jgi:hypothetical protein
MRRAASELDSIRTGFEFDNTLAIITLNRAMEEVA